MDQERKIPIGDIAETEYAYLIDPAYARQTDYGVFYHHPEFPSRHDANQLAKCRCAGDEIGELLDMLDELYAPLDLGFKKISGHDPQTFETLETPLRELGWSAEKTWTMIFRGSPKRKSTPGIQIKQVTQANIADLNSVHVEDGKPSPGHLFHRSQDGRVGGEWIIGCLNGQPVSSTGWYVVGDLARFRGVNTLESARCNGAATTLIRYVQDHPVVRKQRALFIFCNDDGPIRLYEELGFEKYGYMWEFFKTDAA